MNTPLILAIASAALSSLYAAALGLLLNASPVMLAVGIATPIMIALNLPRTDNLKIAAINGFLFIAGITSLLLPLYALDFINQLLSPYRDELVVSLFMAIIAGGLFYFIRDPQNLNPKKGEKALREPSDRDIRVVASHESGHVLMHALALPCLDDSLSLSIDALDAQDIKGYVISYTEPHRCPSADFIEFRLMVLLAGRAAEDILLGGHTGGSRNDLNRWMHLASQYGASCLNIGLYPNPQNSMEAEANLKALTQYQEKQYRNVWRFLDDNRGILKEMRDAAIEKGSLTFDDIRPMLDRVEIPPGFPRISPSLLEPA